MNLTKVFVPLQRLTRLNDGIEHLEDIWGDDISDGYSDDHYSDDDQPLQVQTEDGQWRDYNHDDRDEWIEEDEEMDESPEDFEMDDLPALEQIADGETNGMDVTLPGAWPESDDVELAAHEEPSKPDSPIPQDTSHDQVEGLQNKTQDAPSSQSDTPWRRFDILPSAPPDHAFYGNAPPQPSRQFMARLAKEYRALESSLPGMQPFFFRSTT